MVHMFWRKDWVVYITTLGPEDVGLLLHWGRLGVKRRIKVFRTVNACAGLGIGIKLALRSYGTLR